MIDNCRYGTKLALHFFADLLPIRIKIKKVRLGYEKQLYIYRVVIAI